METAFALAGTAVVTLVLTIVFGAHREGGKAISVKAGRFFLFSCITCLVLALLAALHGLIPPLP